MASFFKELFCGMDDLFGASDFIEKIVDKQDLHGSSSGSFNVC
jgi:hypothetical protein